ncbi:MAG: HmuY family protein [Proteobacteria bacterium]|nr:HmuY family protein [Pseudomonadota bacterium]
MKIEKSTLSIAAVLAAFVAALVYLVASSLVPQTAQEFAPSRMGVAKPSGDRLVVDTVTIDATGSHWVYFNLSDGSIQPNGAGWPWDLAARRFNLVVSGGVLDLGPVLFWEVKQVPDTGYTLSVLARDTSNAVLDEWYEYNWVSHLMKPNGHVYAIRTRDGRFAKIEFLSYYCTGMVSGCMTFRYAFQGGGGTTVSR